MLNVIVKLTQFGVVVFWLTMILSLASLIPAPYRSPVIWIGALVLLIHLSEYFFIRKRLSSQLGSEVSFMKTLVFGLTYWLPLISQNNKWRSDG